MLNKMIQIMNRKQNKEQGLVHMSKVTTGVQLQNSTSGGGAATAASRKHVR